MFMLQFDKIYLPFLLVMLCSICFQPAPATGQAAAESGVPGSSSPGERFAASAKQDALSGDARLEAKISLQDTGTRLSDVCGKLSKAAGVPIWCDRSLGEKRLHLRISDKPVRELMLALGEVVPGTWVRNEEFGSYTLMPNAGAVKYANSWWRTFNKERDKQFSALRDTLLVLMNRKDFDLPEEELRRKEVQNGLQEVRFWRGLPRAAQTQITRLSPFLDTYQKAPIMSYGLDHGAVFVDRADLPEFSFKGLIHAASQLKLDGRLSASEIDDITGVNVFGGGSSLIADIVRRNGTTSSSGIILSLPRSVMSRIVFSDHRWLPEAAKKEGDALPAAWKELLAYQQTTYWPTAPAAEGAESEPLRAPKRKPDSLAELSKKHGFDFVSDYHSLPYRISRPRPGDRHPGTGAGAKPERKTGNDKESELNQAARAHDISWKRSGSGLILFKNNRWYRDDPLEAPDRALEQLQSLYRQAEAADTDEARLMNHLEMASYALTHLNTWQIANGLRYYTDEARLARLGDGENRAKANCQPYADIAATALTYPSLCRFYGMLSANQKRLLVTKRLAAGDISAEQARFLFSAFPGLNRARAGDAFVGLDFRKRGLALVVPDVFSNVRHGNTPYRLKIVAAADAAQ